MFVPDWLFAIGLAVSVFLWARRRSVGRTHRVEDSRDDPDSPRHPLAYSSTCPVFSEFEVRSANVSAIRASRQAAEIESACLSGRDFKECCASREFTETVRRAMTDACEAVVEAEQSWFRHAVMMRANLSATCGRMPREEALTDAEARFKTIPVFGDDAERFRQQWEAKLIAGHGHDPAAFPYSTPWYGRTRAV